MSNDSHRSETKVTFQSPAKEINSLPVGSDRWNELRDLDEQEKWMERSSVVTRDDHSAYLVLAKEIVEELVDRLPLSREENGIVADDEFRPSAEVFGEGNAGQLELDYLDQFTGMTDQQAKLALARQSLYVRFDPLVDKVESPAPAAPALSERFVAGRDLLQLDTPEKVASSAGGVHPTPAQRLTPSVPSSKDLLSGVNATPITNPALTRVRGEAVAAGSPKGVDKLLAFSPDQLQNGTAQSEPGATGLQSEVDVALFSAMPASETTETRPGDLPASLDRGPVPQQTRGEASVGLVDPLQFSEVDLQRRVEEAVTVAVSQRRQTDDSTVATLRQEVESMSSENMSLRDQLLQNQRELDQMRQVVADYDAAMTKNIDHFKQQEEEIQRHNHELTAQNDQLATDINSLENSFAELHRRYEKLRAALETYRKNEDSLKQTEARIRDELALAEEKNRRLKELAAAKINAANGEISAVRKEHQAELAVLKTNLRAIQVKAESLENTVKQKEEENRKLTQICDEMMQQMQQSLRS